MGQNGHIRTTLPQMTAARAIAALMIREINSTYGRSPGGYVWAILQPIGMIVLLSLGFSLLIRSPSLGTSFLVFYATGFLTYDLYNQMQKKILKCITYSRSMLAYPRVTWIDAILARFLLNTLTLVTVFSIVMAAILAFVDERTVIDLIPILIGIILAASLGLGIGTLNCLISGLFPVWESVWKIISRPMFIASGVLFIIEDLPPLAQDILWFNPVIHATGLMRTGFYPTYEASFVSLGYAFGFAMVTFAAGLLFMKAYHQKILEL